MKERLKTLQVVVAVCAVAVVLSWVLLGPSYQRKITVAVVVNDLESPTLKGVQLYLKEYERTHPKSPFRIALDIYNDSNDVSVANKVADTIVLGQTAVAVVGHPWSSTSLEGVSIYEQAGIPMISPSATNPQVTFDHPLSYRIIFNDEFQGQFLEMQLSYQYLHLLV